MAKDNTAWFEDLSLKAEGFEATDCPHGMLRRVDGEDWANCSQCGQAFEITIVED